MGHNNEVDKCPDENGNIYGLTYDLTQLACDLKLAAAATVPPLPPRLDSLPTQLSHHASTRSQCPQVGVADQTRSQMLSATLPSSTNDNAQTQTTLPREPTGRTLQDLPPPLPLPRKKVVVASACAANQVTSTSAPAIPSRLSQSFYIKRPELTAGMSVGDCAAAAREHTGKDAGQTENAQFLTDPVNALSQKMLLDRAHSLHTVVSLKQTQVQLLQDQIKQAFVRVSLTHKSGYGLALVDWDTTACVVGWNQKDFPSLHGKLHIGDVILTVDNVSVTCADHAYKLLRQTRTGNKIDVALRRMPYAQVYAIRRQAEGQSLGIKREGGTGEIVYVDPNGLAGQHGLPQFAPTCPSLATSASSQDGAGAANRCNWFLTEINNRPLNLFYKETEIDLRLSAVGREISFVVQPADFIFHVRRQFKKLKNYKNFITQ